MTLSSAMQDWPTSQDMRWKLAWERLFAWGVVVATHYSSIKAAGIAFAQTSTHNTHYLPQRELGPP